MKNNLQVQDVLPLDFTAFIQHAERQIEQRAIQDKKIPARWVGYLLRVALKVAYGNPVALVHDMGKAILKAVALVFQDIPRLCLPFSFFAKLILIHKGQGSF